ncbi:hyaluronidase-like [Antennarius striatus]|uniref:hyaluronidase-like n=1 Tax=Antennarius striatus TaxID=241820 RepID=UPI0035B38B36
MSSFHPEIFLLFKLTILVSGLQSPFSQVPFLTVWNAPTSRCLSQFGVDIDLSTFSIVQNQNQTFIGGNITIFYNGYLGLYPKYTSQSEAINGGVPQNASLEEHLKVASEDIHKFIPDTDFKGLAVVDWESWKPVWERNWGEKRVYWLGSEALVRAKHPDWSPQQVADAARLEFEDAARKFMEETLKLGQEERPDGLWGFYGFPGCNNHYHVNIQNYTGECPEIEKKRNDELLWLWNASSALYPGIYLNTKLQPLSREVLLFTHHHIMEAMRVGALLSTSPLPVFTYARIVYAHTLEFLSQEHLVYTIGESAALGSAGAVLWGGHEFSLSQTSCEAVKYYIDETLGRYVVNVTSAATLCSLTLCSSHGRCQRRDPSSKAYLHLDPAVWKVVSERRQGAGKSYRVLGQMKLHEVKLMKSEFQCRCYQGWGGESCSKPTQR